MKECRKKIKNFLLKIVLKKGKEISVIKIWIVTNITIWILFYTNRRIIIQVRPTIALHTYVLLNIYIFILNKFEE